MTNNENARIAALMAYLLSQEILTLGQLDHYIDCALELMHGYSNPDVFEIVGDILTKKLMYPSPKKE